MGVTKLKRGEMVDMPIVLCLLWLGHLMCMNSAILLSHTQTFVEKNGKCIHAQIPLRI